MTRGTRATLLYHSPTIPVKRYYLVLLHLRQPMLCLNPSDRPRPRSHHNRVCARTVPCEAHPIYKVSCRDSRHGEEHVIGAYQIIGSKNPVEFQPLLKGSLALLFVTRIERALDCAAHALQGCRRNHRFW